MYVCMYVCMNANISIFFFFLLRNGFEFVSGIAGDDVRSEAAAHGGAADLREHRTVLLRHTYIERRRRQNFKQGWNHEIIARVRCIDSAYIHTYIHVGSNVTVCLFVVQASYLRNTYIHAYVHTYTHTHIHIKVFIHTCKNFIYVIHIKVSMHIYIIHTYIQTQWIIHTYIHHTRLGAYLTLSGYASNADITSSSIAPHTYTSEISWRLGERAADSLSQWSNHHHPATATTYIGHHHNPTITNINSSTISSTTSSSQYHSVNRHISASLNAMLSVKTSETAVLISSKCRSSLFDNILSGNNPIHAYIHRLYTDIHTYYIHTYIQT